MNIYPIAKFLHIAGALGFFTAIGLEWTSLRYLQRAAGVEQAREWMRISSSASRIGIASMVAILVTGAYLMATAWPSAAWIDVTLGTLVLLVGLAVAVTGRRMSAIRKAMSAESSGRISPHQRQLLYHPLLWISVQTRAAMALGIVFLMVTKPDLGGSLLTIAMATSLGIASSLPAAGRKRVQAEPVE